MESSPEVAFFTINYSWLSLYGCGPLAEDAAVSSDGSRFKEFALAHNVGSEMEVDLNSVSSFFSSLFKEFTIGRSAKLLIKQI